MKKIFFYISLLVIIWYWVFLRFYELETGSFWIDEGYSSIISYFMLQNNFLPKLGSGVYEFSQYFFHFFQAISFSFLWISDFSARLPSFLLSLVHILLFYFFSKDVLKNSKYKNIWILFLMCLFLFSTWQIIWSREARFYEMLSVLYLTVTFFLYKYIDTKKSLYLNIFFFFLFLGILFHHFFFAFVFIVFFLFLWDFFLKKDWKNMWVLLVIIFLYWIVQLLVKQFSGFEVDIWWVFPKINYIEQYDFFTFFSFYLQVCVEQLWIIFYFYIAGVFYFLFTKKWQIFILFWILVFFNIFVISFWYFAHSRYIFHLFSLIILIGWYTIFAWGEYLFEHYKRKYKNVAFFLFTLLVIIWIFFTYQFTFFPQRFYYIDQTSPKPNFKNTYEYIKNTYPEAKIISWFPHMCYWYNRENNEKCEYALRVNLIGNDAFNEMIQQKTTENYTNISYIDDFSQIDISKYLFVFDDLTLKNALSKKLLEDVMKNCQMIYKDVWDYETANFIWIWKCQ